MTRPVKTTRKQTSAQKREDWWAQKLAAAKTPREAADIEWNYLRAAVHKVSGERKGDAWTIVRRHLRDANDEIQEAEARAAERARPYPSSRPAPLAKRFSRYVAGMD